MNSLKDLIDMKAFIPDELVPRQITFDLDDGKGAQTFDIFVRRMSIGVHEAIWADGGSLNPSKTARLLSEAIRLGEKGEEKLTYQQAFELNAKIALEMSKAITDVNGGGERKN
jgi:hypothetical protein